VGFEIDFMAVGEKSSGGDAIALRYGNLHGSRDEQRVIVIDGGYTASGSVLVGHIRNHYQTDYVDIVLSTHTDQDHIKGLEVVIDELRVGHLLMHQPWIHLNSLAVAKSLSFMTLSAGEKFTKSLREMSALEELAKSKRIPITEPFAGLQIDNGMFRILGPSVEYYETLLPDMASTESPLQKLLSLANRGKESVLARLIPEDFEHETLRDDGVAGPSNNSSVISLLSVDGYRCLFTADAGIPALEQAASVLETEGFTSGSLAFVQIPHHGSRRNVGPTVLNRLLGAKGKTSCHATAFVSAPPENPDHKHPSKKVTNAFTRRGYEVHATAGINKWHRRNAPPRTNYVDSTPVPFHPHVEEDED